MANFDRTSSPPFLRRLLIEPEYRMARHLILILILVVTALNQAFMTMRVGLDVMGHTIFIQVLFLFITYLITCYFNLWVLLPRHLLKKRYIQYMVYLVITIFLLVTFQTAEERMVLSYFNILDDFYTLPRIVVNILSSTALVLLCVSGGAMTVLLKHWITDNRKVNQLEKLHIQSEVEQLKEQLNPHLLFNILNRTRTLAKHQPEEASDMLIRLSQLLRYQLYDCNREKVLLNSEIKFMNNYLTLEKMYSGLFKFDIRSDKGCSHVLVAPLLSISFVQSAVIRIYELKQATSVNILFETADSTVTFTCRCPLENVFFNMDFSKIRKRLDFLYPNRYSSRITGEEVTLIIEI